MKKSIIIVVLSVAMLLAGGRSALAQTSCLSYPSGTTAPSGYAQPWDVYDGTHPLLVKTNCPTSGTTLNLTIGKGDPANLAYKISYSYHPGMTPPWQPQTLSGTVSSGDWLAGNGTGTLTAPLTASATNPFFFVGYTCQLRSSVWKCGCADTSCTTGKWQLQGYKGLGGGTTTTGGSTTGGTGGTTGGTVACPLKGDLFNNPFKADSAMHKPIGTGATYASDSDPMTVDWLTKGRGGISINVGSPFGVNMYKVTVSDPMRVMGADPLCSNHRDLPASFRFPAGGVDAPENPEHCKDGMITVYDSTTEIFHQVRSYHWNGGSPSGMQHFATDAHTLGHGARPGDRVGTSASGIASTFGLLRGIEINTDGMPIRHAFQISLPWGKDPDACDGMLKPEFIAPAVSKDGNTYEIGAIPYGTLLAIPPESKGGPNLDSLGLSPDGRRLAEAFRNYGAYVVDSTQCPTIRADQFIENVDQLKAEMRKFYQYIRPVTNSEWHTGESAVGGGTPIAPNCAFDAP